MDPLIHGNINFGIMDEWAGYKWLAHLSHTLHVLQARIQLSMKA